MRTGGRNALVVPVGRLRSELVAAIVALVRDTPSNALDQDVEMATADDHDTDQEDWQGMSLPNSLDDLASVALAFEHA